MINSFLPIEKEVKITLVEQGLDDLTLSKKEVETLKMSVKLLMPVQEAVLELSTTDSNLITADFVFEKMLSTIEKESSSELRDELLSALEKRILERRTKYSDILIYLNRSHLENYTNRFYKPPTIEEFRECLPIHHNESSFRNDESNPVIYF